MNYQTLYQRKTKNELIRNIMITRKQRKEIINNFCMRNTSMLKVSENKILLGIERSHKFHPFIKRVCSYFTKESETEHMNLSRAQTFRGLKIPFAYFSANESLLYAFNSYLHDYEKRAGREWRIHCLLEQALCDTKTKDQSLFMSGVMLFNSAIDEEFDQVKLAQSFVMLQEINPSSPLHAVAIVFMATYHVLQKDFSEAFDTIAFYDGFEDNMIYKLFEDKITTYLPKSNLIYFKDFFKTAA